MSNKFNSDEMQTLFHLLDGQVRPTLSNFQINQICEAILIDFKTLLNDNNIKEILNQACLLKYKMNLEQTLQISEINLLEMSQFSENQALWIELLTLIYLLINENLDKIQTFLVQEVKNLIKNIKSLDQQLQLKLNLYK